MGAAPSSYSYSQLEQLWIKYGGNKVYAPIAAAIAMAESSGRVRATDIDSNGTVDRGLWQINSVHGSQSTYDVAGNTRAAIAISNGGRDWHPWVTFNTGAYKKYLNGKMVIPSGRSAGTTIDTGGGTNLYGGKGLNIPNPLSGIEAVGAFFNTLSEWSTWKRVFEVAGGAILIGAGLVLMSKEAGVKMPAVVGNAAEAIPGVGPVVSAVKSKTPTEKIHIAGGVESTITTNRRGTKQTATHKPIKWYGGKQDIYEGEGSL
jgi:Lysozyme like domain